MGMKVEKWLNQLDKFTRGFSGSLEWVGVIGLLLMFLANFVDVVGAKLFLWPLPGATEVISFSQIVAIAPAIAFTLILGRHIRVEFIIDRFPKRIRAAISEYQFFFVIDSLRSDSLAELCLRSIFAESRRDRLNFPFAFLPFRLPHRLLLYSGLFGLLDGSPQILKRGIQSWIPLM